MNQSLFLGTHSWAVEPTDVNYTARIGGLYGTLMRAEVLLPAKIHSPAFIRKFSKHYFYKIKSCGVANKSGEICLGKEHVVSLYGCSAAFLLLEIIIKKDENNISQRRWQGKNLTDVENGAPFGADENGSQGAARLKDEGSIAVYSSGKFD